MLNIIKPTKHLYTLVITADALKIMPQLKVSFDSMAKDAWKEGNPVKMEPRVLICTIKMVTEKPLSSESVSSLCTTMLNDAVRKYPNSEAMVECAYAEIK